MINKFVYSLVKRKIILNRVIFIEYDEKSAKYIFVLNL